MSKKPSFFRKLSPLLVTQFLGVFNDHGFKTVAVLAAVSTSAEYSDNAAFLAVVTIAFALPFLILAEPAGFMADRFAKRNVLVFTKMAELLIMLLGTFFLSKVSVFGVVPLIGVMFLMASQSTFFSPSFNGLLPELFSEKKLSRANGNSGMCTFLAVILGVAGGFLLKDYCGNKFYRCGWFFSFCSFIGLIAAMKTLAGLPANKKRRWSWNFFSKYLQGFRFIKSRRPLFLAILGDAYFLALGTAMQAMLIVFAKHFLGVNNDLEIGLIQLAPAIGMGFGCYLAGRLSGGKVELGLVPFGSMGLVIFLILAALFPGKSYLMGGLNVFPLEMFFLSALGLFGGLFIIPLRAYQQHRTDEVNRGTVLANANVICFIAILLAGVLMFLLTSGKNGSTPSEGLSSLNGIMTCLQSFCLNLEPVSMMLGLSILTLLVSIYTFWILPDFALRFVVVILTHTIYKLRIRGSENIPEQGPALLVANHVSFVDGLLISACSSRTVRFLMHEDFYNFPLFYPIAKWAGFIPVPNPGNPKKILRVFEQAKAALRNGDVVCIFPEGKLTRNGIMVEFKEGLTRMLPEEMDIPVIPVRLGMLWGSIFSFYYGKVRLRLPKAFPHPAAVTIGKPVSKDIKPFALRQLISEMGAETEMDPRQEERPIHYQFSKITKRHPFSKNFKDFKGTELSNFSLLVRSTLLSCTIRRMEAYDESPYIGVMLPNTTAATTSILSVMMADKVPAILNFTASAQSLDSAMELGGIKIILTSRLFLLKAKLTERPEMVFLEDIAKKIPKWKKLMATLGAAILPHQDLMNFLAPETHRDVFKEAVLLFSSGSTGIPKGVALTHHNINSNVYSFLRILGWRDSDKILGNLPLFHSFGMTTQFWLPLMINCEVVYLPNPLDSVAVGEALDTHKLTILLATPTFLQAYMRKCSADQFKSLRIVITGAEKLRKDISDRFQKMTGIVVMEGYGCTELSPVVSVNIAENILNFGRKAGKSGSIGLPMPGICVKIVDPETRVELAPGNEGLMLVKGPNVMNGYLNNPEKTAEVLQDGWYNTGDIAKTDSDGYLTIVGRLSRFSKIAGEMVPHELIESKINEILGAEKKLVAICGAPDKAKGEKIIALHLELQMELEVLISKLREAKVPNLWIPKAKDFHQIQELPILGSGKLDLANLSKIAAKFAES